MSNIKIRYFIDYWRDLTHENNSIESELVHSILYNPKELFKEFIEEIERENLSKSDNKKFFIDKINEFSKLDLESLVFIKPTLKLIQQQFSKQDDYSYLLHLLKMAKLKLQNFILGKEAVKELAKLLTNESEINTIKIKHLTNLIIFELIHKKYAYKTIAKIIDNIFMDYQVLHDDILHTSFPHNIKCNNCEPTSSDFKEYQKELKSYIDNLTCEDRILAIGNYFSKESEELRFVFQIKGLKGDDVNITIDNVQIYNPKKIRLFNKQTEYFDELFTKEKDNIYYNNGAVTLKVIDIKYARQEALQILENTLDIISSRYIYYKVPITINTSKYYVIDKEGNECTTIIDKEGNGSIFSNTLKLLTYKYSLDLNDSEYDNKNYIEKIVNNQILEIDKKILESMHWKRRAIESNENNEKILWHWVALENIFSTKNQNTPKVIFEVVSKLLAEIYIFNFAWKHYAKLQVNLPSDLKNKMGLVSNDAETIYLKNLIDNIGAIKPHLDEDSLFYEQLINLETIFLDTTKCLQLIEKFEQIFSEKLKYIYRVRNKIVHNAYTEMSPIIQYYVEFIALVSTISISTFTNKRAELSLETSEDIINNIIYDYDKFKLELKEKGTNILYA